MTGSVFSHRRLVEIASGKHGIDVATCICISARECERHSCKIGATGEIQSQMTLLAFKIIRRLRRSVASYQARSENSVASTRTQMFSAPRPRPGLSPRLASSHLEHQ